MILVIKIIHYAVALHRPHTIRCISVRSRANVITSMSRCLYHYARDKRNVLISRGVAFVSLSAPSCINSASVPKMIAGR